jgi:hypothetical protein
MTQAKRVHSTPRRTASKIKAKLAKSKTVDSGLSPIIEQCVIYVQCLAAYDAGFSIDVSGNSDYAGKGDHLESAKRAMVKLLGLSPHARAGAAPLTPAELFSKAAVLAAMIGLRKDHEPDHIETAYIRFFFRRSD